MSLEAAWAEFQATANQARGLLEDTDRFRKNPDYRGPAYTSLLEAQAMAYNFAIAPTRSTVPEVMWHATWHSNLSCLGQPNQDFQYGGIFLGDWLDDAGTLSVSVTGGPALPALTEADHAEAITAAAGCLLYLVRAFTVGLYDLYIARADGQKNNWAVMPGQSVSTSLIGSPSTTYVPAVFEIAPTRPC